MMSGEFQTGSPLNPSEASAALLRGEWPDFYALLGVSREADEETLRRRIRESYVEATTNADHRNIARRIHFQTMAEQVLPQCHRILLDAKTRAAYDEQSRLHHEGAAGAREYSSFLSNTLGGDETKTRDENAHMILGSVAENKTDAHRQEMEEARALLESLGRGPRRDIGAPSEENPLSTQSQTPQPAAAREYSGETQNREEARLRARYAESTSNDTQETDLASRGAETQRAGSVTSRGDTSRSGDARENDAVAAHLKARIAPPESGADLASVAESPAATETTQSAPLSEAPAQQVPPAESSAAPPRPRLSSRALRDLENIKPSAEPSPEADQFLPASGIAPPDEAASTRATSNTEKDTANSRLQSDITARRAARVGSGSEQTSASPQRATRSNATPAAITNGGNQSSEIAPDEGANAISRANAAPQNNAATTPRAADSSVAASAKGDETVSGSKALSGANASADAANPVASSFATPISPAPTTSSAGGAAVSGGAEGGASTREAMKSERSAQEIARDFADAPADAVRAHTIYAPRVSLSENADSLRAAGSAGRGKRLLSQAAMNVLVGVIAAVASLIIFRPSATPARIPLNVTCASELCPFLQQAKNEFEKSPQGATIDVNLSPMDARDAMRYALDPKATPPDAWIPSETLWSERYNQVAAKSGGKVIRVARSLALSPIVLLARGDQANALRRQFPSHTIPSWQALQNAVRSSASGHLGLTDPGKSGSGAIARLFMAREWCEKNGVEWNEKALSNKRLWKWMQGFENNVPSYAKLTGDMARDLALGTADRYWWALVYESDAIFWMKQRKELEVFYLPVSNYADHPFCRIDSGSDNAQMRDTFESFLRAPQMQKVLLESGFRPTETELSQSGAANPFNSADLKKRGLKAKGFRIDDRINYKLLNALNVQWAQRYKG